MDAINNAKRIDSSREFPRPFRVDTDTSRGRVEVHGELDLAAAGDLDEALDRLLPRPGRTMLVDLSDLTFCDCAGLEVLLSHHNRVRMTGGVLLVINPTARVERLLSLTGVDRELDVRTLPVAGRGQVESPDRQQS